jgi:hypothetical protein
MYNIISKSKRIAGQEISCIYIYIYNMTSYKPKIIAGDEISLFHLILLQIWTLIRVYIYIYMYVYVYTNESYNLYATCTFP